MCINFFFLTIHAYEGFFHGSDGKESACSAGDPGSGKSSGEENGNHSSILVWRIPWTEEPGGLLSIAESWTRLSG